MSFVIRVGKKKKQKQLPNEEGTIRSASEIAEALFSGGAHHSKESGVVDPMLASITYHPLLIVGTQEQRQSPMPHTDGSQ